MIFFLPGAYQVTYGPVEEYGIPTQVVMFATYVSCTGNEAQIEDCYGFLEYQHYVYYCPTNYVAGVKCLGELTMDVCTCVFVYTLS